MSAGDAGRPCRAGLFRQRWAQRPRPRQSPDEAGRPRSRSRGGARAGARSSPTRAAPPRSAPQREGSGVLVREGYVATIGYLVIESESIEVTGADGKSVPAALAAYDHASGFGLLKLLAPLAGKPLPLGDSNAAAEREPVLVACYGGRRRQRGARGVAPRVLRQLGVPARRRDLHLSRRCMNWSGASLISAQGRAARPGLADRRRLVRRRHAVARQHVRAGDLLKPHPRGPDRARHGARARCGPGWA